jgi:hypothetical protein
MLYVTNEDKPGFIGALGTTLGDAGINIATFHLGRADGLPEIFLPSARRRALHVLRYEDGEITLLGRELYDAQIVGDFRLEDLDGNGMDEVIYQLDDGLEVRLYR